MTTNKKSCRFCEILAKRDEVIVWENSNFYAVLDRFPNVRGQAIVVSKAHYPSYAFDLPEEEYSDLMKAAKIVAKILEKSLNVKRVAMVMEGLGINHTHLKLYPLWGLNEKFSEIWSSKKVFFEKYPGYISTQTGKEVNKKPLEQLAEKIKASVLK